MREVLKEDFEPAVVIPRECGHNAFFPDFAPIVLIEKVSDAGENSNSPVPEFHLCRQVPDVVGGDEPFEGVAIVTKFIVNERAKKREFERVLVVVDRSRLDLVIWSVCRYFAVIRPGGEFGVQQCDISVKQELPVRAGDATIDQRQNVQFGRGFKSDVTRVADVGGGSKTVQAK